MIDEKETNLLAHLKKSSWKNIDNHEFYEGIPLETFKVNSILGGLGEGGDLDLITDYIFKANSILEVGAGYGRVLNYLVSQGFKGKISAIERSKKYARLLNKKFGNRVTIFDIDLQKFQTEEKFDLILWMFSGVSDFAKHEQLLVLRKLKQHLVADGNIILDTFSHSLKPANAINAEKQSYIITEGDYTLYGYIPSIEEIEMYAKCLDFREVKHLPYTTKTNSHRLIHILLHLSN